MLTDTVAIVTGGGRGLGRAVALALAGAGAAVAVASRTKSEVEDTAGAISDAGGRAMAVKADVSDPGDVENLVKAVGMKLGEAGVLVNNAGVIGPVAELKDVSLEEFDRCMAINFRAMLLMSRAVIPGMIKKRRGKIINVTSGLAEGVLPRFGAYCVSKAAVNHFTRILADELARYNIQVNGLDPGTVDTRMHEDIRAMDIGVLGSEAYRMFWNLKKSGQLKDPAEAAALAVFLASDESDALTGMVGSQEYYMKLGYRKVA